jgi:DNA primase
LELGRLLFQLPSLAALHGETLAALSFSDTLLDRLRRELLNLAASGFRLESGGLENHLVRKGMAELVARFDTRRDEGGVPSADIVPGGADDREARFLRAAASLRDMAELEPERSRAVERFNDEPSAENWADAQRLLAGRTLSND